jgi:hypothetical protein
MMLMVRAVLLQAGFCVSLLMDAVLVSAVLVSAI